MAAGPHARAAVQEVLALLSPAGVVTAVALYRQLPGGTAHITVRKMAHRPGPRTQYRYGWEVRVMAGERSWEWVGTPAYTTAEAAYQAAVEAVPAAVRSPMAEQAAGDGR